MANRETFVTNAAESTLSSALSSGSTTVNVTDTTDFPAVPFYATIDPGNDAKREVVRATAKTATTLTVVRAEDGTADVAHDSGAVIAIVPVAALWTDINDRVDAAYTAGGTDVAVADGGTGASTAGDARTNLGLGTIATQSAASVAITGGSVTGITDLAVADGGTGASTAADARTNLSAASTSHAATHSNGGTDEVTVENLGTAATDTSLVLKPDGTGGVNFAAGSATSGLTVIAETVLGSAAASIDFTSIPSTYRHLRLVCDLRTDRASTGDGCQLRFNGDTASNYDYARHYGPASGSPSSDGALAASSIIVAAITGGSASAGLSSSVVIDVPNYAGTTFNKTARSTVANKISAALADVIAFDGAGFWRSTAAINRVTLLPQVGTNFVAGSTVTLYGVATA